VTVAPADGPAVAGVPARLAGLKPRALSDCVVVVTPRSFGMHDPGLRRRLEREVGVVRYRPGPLAAAELAEAACDADGLLCGLDQVSAEVFAGAPRLRVVARYGVGADRVDLEAAARYGVTVTTTPGANANAVAELTIALLFALARPLVAGRDRARAGEWPALSGVELDGRTLGLVGLGRIGSLVAGKAAALGLRVLAYDPNVSKTDAATLIDLDALVAESDFVSLHAPLTDQTRGWWAVAAGAPEAWRCPCQHRTRRPDRRGRPLVGAGGGPPSGCGPRRTRRGAPAS